MKKKIKLSMAIREGSKLRPKCKEHLFFDGKSCALGAAYEYVFGKVSKKALSGDYTDNIYVKLENYFEETLKNFYDSIVEKNDDHNWSREKIANWLEKQGV